MLIKQLKKIKDDSGCLYNFPISFESEDKLTQIIEEEKLDIEEEIKEDEKRKEDQKIFKEKRKREKDEYNEKLKAIKQNVENRPLMMEVAGRKEDVIDMKQDVDGKM